MKSSSIFTLLLLALIGINSLAASQSNFDACHSCHGSQLQGDPDKFAPGLAGQSPTYLRRQLENFVSSARGYKPADTNGKRMQRMSILFSTPGLIEAAVEYIGTYAPTHPDKPEIGNPQDGKHAFEYACRSCHGELGYGSDLFNAPGLRFLGSQYLFDQIIKFQKGLRGMHPDDPIGNVMHNVSFILQDDQMIRDVIAYMQTLPQIDFENTNPKPYDTLHMFPDHH